MQDGNLEVLPVNYSCRDCDVTTSTQHEYSANFSSPLTQNYQSGWERTRWRKLSISLFGKPLKRTCRRPPFQPILAGLQTLQKKLAT